MRPDNQKLLDFLRGHLVASLATIRPDGRAHASTIYYAIDENLNFFFVTKEGTNKHTNIERNAAVALAISDETTLDTVQIEGAARRAAGKEFLSAIDTLTQKVVRNHRQWDKIPASLIKSGQFAFYVIEPSWIRWMNYQDWNDIVKFEYPPKT